MTRKEAIKRIKRILEECKEYNEDDEIAACYVTSDDADALNAAIKTLEQEPYEDAISRKSMLNYQEYLYGLMPNEENFKLWEFIKNLPSVTPTQKKGKWVKMAVTNGRGRHECNICHTYAPSYQNGDEYLSEFCPCCGAIMDEEEGNDKQRTN